MTYLKSNYPLKKASNPNNPAKSIDYEAEMLKRVGGSFVYFKTRKTFIVT